MSKQFSFRPVIVIGLLCLVSPGCSSNTDTLGRQRIGGTVKLDGQPLDQGSIRFEPVSGDTKISTGAVILNGSYQIASDQGLPPGSYKISLTAPEVLPMSDQTSMPKMGEPMVIPKERIPPSYNVESQLVVEVSDGENLFDIDVESAKQK